MGVRMRRKKLVNCFFRNSNRSMYIGLINLSFSVEGNGGRKKQGHPSMPLMPLLVFSSSSSSSAFFISMYETAAWKKKKRTKDPQPCPIRSVDILIAFVGEEKWLFFYHQQNDICRRFAHIVLAVSIIYSCVRLIDINQTFTPHWFNPAIREGHTGVDSRSKDRRSARRRKKKNCLYLLVVIKRITDFDLSLIVVKANVSNEDVLHID